MTGEKLVKAYLHELPKEEPLHVKPDLPPQEPLVDGVRVPGTGETAVEPLGLGAAAAPLGAAEVEGEESEQPQSEEPDAGKDP